MDPIKIIELEGQLEHTFIEKKELYRALTHSTFSKEEKERKIGKRDCPHQETYATLGDAILKAGFVMLLMEKGLNTKGDITIIKADLEKNFKLVEVGKRLRLLEDNLIWHRMGDGEQLEKGMKTLFSDTVEAIIGAIFLFSTHIYSAVSDTANLPITVGCVTESNTITTTIPQTPMPITYPTPMQQYTMVTLTPYPYITPITRIAYPRPTTGMIVSGNYIYGGEGELTIDNTAGNSDVVSILTYDNSK